MTPHLARYEAEQETPAVIERVQEPMTVREWRKANPIIFPADAVPLSVPKLIMPWSLLLLYLAVSAALGYLIYQGAVWGWGVVQRSAALQQVF